MEVNLRCNNQNSGLYPWRYCPESWLRKQESVNKDTENLAGRWSFHVKEMIKCRGFNKEDVSVHVVKEGETLSSVSKQYGVSVNSIATTNRNIVDLDLGYDDGQHIKVPSFQGNTLKTDAINLPSLAGSPQRPHNRISRIFNQISKQNNYTVLVDTKLPNYHAKTAGYFLLVLVPLIAFCIRCISSSTFCNRIVINKPNHRIGGSRWKSALFDIREPDNSDPPYVDNCSSEEQDELSVEDASTGYELEKDYEKFLLECGITTSGYRRGGDAE